uniref:Cytochrome P450 n=1 Tax=Setaria viridis TaxID=4556 RepID=A0A4V6D185_SETVI|nr:hypothetical protein SEVIR_9G241100v2 [Setaria viridis]
MADQVLVAVLLVLLSKLKSSLSAKPKLNLPPGPWTLPVIGSIHHLIANPLIYRTLRGLAQKHGPLMTIRLGEAPVLVVSSPEAAREVLKTHDTTFADRFTNATAAAISYNATDVALSPYGERWRQLRKICVLELLSAVRVQSFRRIREEEVARFMRSVAASAAAGDEMDMSAAIFWFIYDAFMRECVGSRCKYQGSRIMQMLATAPRKALACRDRMQRVLERVMKEKKEAMDSGAETVHESFVGFNLANDVYTMNNVMATRRCRIITVSANGQGFSRTGSAGRQWPRCRPRCEKPSKGRPQSSRMTFYLKLVIKETLRMHSHLPFLIPRRCRKTSRVMGYDIPEGTTVLINVWAICRDPQVLGRSRGVQPERFESNNMDYKGTNYEYLPFGSGRRMCPGATLGLANISLALLSLLYHFDWKLCDGVEPKDVDVREAVGIIANKRTNLVLRPVTRIAPANA